MKNIQNSTNFDFLFLLINKLAVINYFLPENESYKMSYISKYSCVPAFTFNGKPKGSVGNTNPGPGNYDSNGLISSTKNRDPKWGFTKNARDNNLDNHNPGPGAYDSGNKGKIPGGYLGDKGKNDNKLDVPGPGTYEQNSN